LEARSKSVIFYKLLRTFGLGESQLETDLQDLIDGQTDPTLATYAKEGECSLRIASKRPVLREAQQAVADMQALVQSRIGRYIYSYDDEELAVVTAKKLIAAGVSISSAESCTGGMFAERLTDVPGISAVFDRGFVTYSNRAKIEVLGVPEETLERYGAVSEETALAMAHGVRRVTGSRLSVSVTGIAGPDGATSDKPVGLVYIGCVFDGAASCHKAQMRNTSRKWNRNFAVLSMFYSILRLLEGAAPS
jgi:nicotinamide-nucleotide amidase